MNLSKEEYAQLIRERMPRSPIGKNCLLAFLIGGGICCLAQGLLLLFQRLGADEESAASWGCIAMVFLGALFTGLGLYDRLARHGGAGTLVPITGFANAVCSPALEFKTEGLITGLAVKIFSIVGPVLLYGALASAVYGVVLLLL